MEALRCYFSSGKKERFRLMFLLYYPFPHITITWHFAEMLSLSSSEERSIVQTSENHTLLPYFG